MWVVAFSTKCIYAVVQFNFISLFAHLRRWCWTYEGLLMIRTAEHPSQRLSKLPFIFNCSPQWRPIKDEDSRVRITHKPFEGHRLSICFAGRLPLTHFICARMQTLGHTLCSIKCSTVLIQLSFSADGNRSDRISPLGYKLWKLDLFSLSLPLSAGSTCFRHSNKTLCLSLPLSPYKY